MITRRGFGSAAIALGTAAAARGSGTTAANIVQISKDTTIAADTMVPAGGGFAVAAGATLTFTGDFAAAATRVFAGPGHVDLTHSRIVAARPEWWGAVADDPRADCAPALESCLVAHHAMQLGLGDYYLARPLRIDRPNRLLWGVGRSKDFRGTRLLLKASSGPVIFVGTEAPPSTINDFLWGIELRALELGRTAAPAVPHGDPADAAGLRVRHVVDCRFEGLRADEHAIGFSVRGAVRTFIRECSAFRSLAGHDGGDSFVGFDMDGRSPPPAIATGGNASLYVIDCLVRTGGHPRLALSAGCRLTGTFSDTFIDRLEATDVAIGILVDGQRATLDAAQRRAGHVDLHIRGAVLDQCGDAGIRLTGLSDGALVDVDDPYVALAPTGVAALDIADCGGNVGVRGGQLIGWTGGPAATGVRLRDTSGVAVAGTKLAGFARPVEAAASTAFDLDVGINNRGPAATGPAVRLAACTHGSVRPRITGRAGAFAAGVAADAGCDAVEIATAGIVPATVGTAVTVDGHAAPAAAGRVWLVRAG